MAMACFSPAESAAVYGARLRDWATGDTTAKRGAAGSPAVHTLRLIGMMSCRFDGRSTAAHPDATHPRPNPENTQLDSAFKSVISAMR